MPNFFFLTRLKTGQNMTKHKMILIMSKWASIKLKLKLNEQVSALSSFKALPRELQSCVSLWNAIVIRWTYTLWINSDLMDASLIDKNQIKIWFLKWSIKRSIKWYMNTIYHLMLRDIFPGFQSSDKEEIIHVQGVARHRSHFQISITFSNFNILTKFKHWITKKGWKFFVILIEKKSRKKSVSSSCSSRLVQISMTGAADIGHIFTSL